ncbi:DEAD-domain-containing protein [Auriscalpium vulgare]|uniref:DEAD-domain-containing protein n=1 Tax=Auriscalpium vulgare TaxID=40419 RepID=A0ACB8R7U2_9AGAM|nr:DEAD-domain-containing protein [Auriscalpium vulgare]
MDDDGLVLNLVDDTASTSRAGAGKKGGRWTDRLKAKRVEKRKVRHSEPSSHSRDPATPTERPAKRPRTDAQPRSVPQPSAQPKPRLHTQVISSLFSYNPKIEKSAPSSTPSKLAKPSNAPLTDSSTFAGLGLDPLITAHLNTKMNILKPTSIQRAALPALLTPSDPSSSRDAFIQSQTGSGKTLSYLLPIIQDLLPLSSQSYIDRSIGTLAVIIAPTRELAKQIYDVLEHLLKLRLRPHDETPEDADVDAEDGTASGRLTRWLVPGLLTGGATRTHEKARLRKGVPILVSTPGRLLDHLQNTSSFNVGKCRWLVLDEADRLMELGFADTVKGILAGLDGRRKLAMQAVREGHSIEVGGWDWDVRRRTVLCSATMRDDVQVLAGTTLREPIMIKATEADLPAAILADGTLAVPAANEKFTPPSQLSQKFVVVPLKLRLVTLVALLRSLLSQAPSKRSSKIIVFLSCTDSVDFHWRLLGGSAMDGGDGDGDAASDSDGASSDADGEDKPAAVGTDKVEVKSQLLPNASIFRLHGSLPLATRLSSLRAFSAVPKAASVPTASILLCTSVASRGLDLPLVRAVVQYDLPTEGGATEYVHRVGRTARAGKGGEAWSIVAPSEAAWVKWVEGKMLGKVEGAEPVAESEGDKAIRLQGVDVNDVLKSGFGGKGGEYEERATDVQLAFERWCLQGKENAELARKAFASHMRAYATHPSDEKHLFHIRHLHIGHLAKAFALREAPSSLKSHSASSKAKDKTKAKTKFRADKDIGAVPASKVKLRAGTKGRRPDDDDGSEDEAEAERRMREAVRKQGKLVRKGGVMMSSGAAEFQLASGYDLEKMVGRT